MNLRRMAARISGSDLELIPNPFPSSKFQKPVFHGTRHPVRKFTRPESGVWFAGKPGWVDDKYGSAHGDGSVVTCWIDVRNPYEPTLDEFYDYYDYDGMQRGIRDGFWKKLREDGYDAYHQGGDSDSIAVFDTVRIVNAKTGEEM